MLGNRSSATAVFLTVAAALALRGQTWAQEQGPAGLAPGEGPWANYDFVPGPSVIYASDFDAARKGRFPTGQLEYVEGNAQIVDQGGDAVLELTDATKFHIDLPESLPENFTLEFMARIGAPHMKINVFFGPFEGPLGRYEHAYLSVWRRAGIEVKGREISATDDYKEVAERMVPVRFSVEGDYATMYMDSVEVANVPVADIPRAATIDFDVTADRTRPAYIRNIVVATGETDAARSLEQSGEFTTRGIIFEEGGDVLRPESTPALESIRLALEGRTDLSVVVEDHTAADPDLSERRASAIVHYLVGNGVSEDRVTAVGKGDSDPATDESTPAGRVENRRVVVATAQR